MVDEPGDQGADRPVRLPAAALLFQAPDLTPLPPRRPARQPEAAESAEPADAPSGRTTPEEQGSSRRRRGSRGRRRPQTAAQVTEVESDDGGAEAVPVAPEVAAEDEGDEETAEGTEGAESGTHRRRRRRRPTEGERARQEVTSVEGSTRLEAKRQRRRESRDSGRRRQTVTEAEFLARRESVDRRMVVREKDGLNQIAVLEDGILVEHYVARRTQTSLVGNVYLGRVQNVLPSMEAAFVDIGKGRNAVLYAGEVNWDAAGMEGQPRRIEQALKSGDNVLVQVTKDPIGHKGARLTSQITLAGRHLVLVPSGAMTGISRKLPEQERARLKKLLREIVPDQAGVIVRTAAEGATEEQLRDDVARLVRIWEEIQAKAAAARSVPVLLKGEPELAVRVVRDVFNEDFAELIVSGEHAWNTISRYVRELSPDLADRVHHWTGAEDVFAEFRVDEQLAKGMDRKVWLPSGGSLIIDRTEAMTVIDVNTGRFTGAGGSLEETVTRNNLEAAEEIVRQLRLRDIGGIIVIDFIDMVLESNRDLVLRRLVECLGRDRTRHQVAEVTSLGLVQMTRKRVGQGLVEAFSETCEHCGGRGFIVHTHPVEKSGAAPEPEPAARPRRRKGREEVEAQGVNRQVVKDALATIAAAAASAHADHAAEGGALEPSGEEGAPGPQGDGGPEGDGGEAPEAGVPAGTSAAEGVRPRRGGRRRVVAAGSPPGDVTEGIITLPQRETGPQPQPVLSPAVLDSLVFPERSEARPERRAPRRATAAAAAPGAAADTGEPGAASDTGEPHADVPPETA